MMDFLGFFRDGELEVTSIEDLIFDRSLDFTEKEQGFEDFWLLPEKPLNLNEN